MVKSSDKKNSQPIKSNINHIAIAVTDLSESERFYRDVLGLRQIPEPFKEGRHAWFDLGGAQLHVIKAADQRTSHNRSTHFCFSVKDLDAFIEEISAHGLVYSDSDGKEGEINIRPDGIRQIFFTDPDGYWVEVNDEFEK